MYNQNALLQYLYQMQQAQQPQNMLASADQGFDPNGIVAQMLARQRAAEAAKAAQQGKQKIPPTRPGIIPAADDVLKRRMREAGLE